MARKKQAKKTTGHRLQQIFWLDDTKGPVETLYNQWLKISEKALAFELEVLKGRRQFSAAMREGSIIWIEAMQGNTAFFEKRFPGLVQSIVSRYQNRQIADLQQQLKQLQDQLDSMTFGQPMSFAAPVVEEEVEPIEFVPLQGTSAVQNFMNSMLGL